MNSFISKLLTLKYGKKCPDIKLISTQGDVIVVTFESGKKARFSIQLTHIPDDVED